MAKCKSHWVNNWSSVAVGVILRSLVIFSTIKMPPPSFVLLRRTFSFFFSIGFRYMSGHWSSTPTYVVFCFGGVMRFSFYGATMSINPSSFLRPTLTSVMFSDNHSPPQHPRFKATGQGTRHTIIIVLQLLNTDLRKHSKTCFVL